MIFGGISSALIISLLLAVSSRRSCTSIYRTHIMSATRRSDAEGFPFDDSRCSATAANSINNADHQLLSSSRRAFIDWAVENAVPITSLEPYSYSANCSGNKRHNEVFFQALAGAIQACSASIVMLSEGYHNCKEMMTLHHAIIQHLVENLEFRIVASESGLPESRSVSSFIKTRTKYSPDDEDEVWKKGLNKMYSEWAEGRALIEWMAAYNQAQWIEDDDDDSPALIDYCGLDIGGFYTDWTSPMSKIQSYLKCNFAEFEHNWSKRINPFLNALGTTKARYNYQHILTAAEKNNLALLLDELVHMMTSKRQDFKGDLEFEWARQSAISMQLAENYYRNYEHMSTNDISNKYCGLNGREIAMSNNMIWRLHLDCTNERRGSRQQQQRQQKMIVINHVIHTKTATQYQGEIWGHFVPMGQMAKQLLINASADQAEKQSIFNVGMLYGGGTFWNEWQKPDERRVATVPSRKADGLEATMKVISVETGMKNFFVHWERAPAESMTYLKTVSTIRENDYFINAFPLEWNGCIYLDHVTHATPAK